MEGRYRPAIPAKLVIAMATIVSTTISLVAGVLLYQESVAALHDTVEEVSKTMSESLVVALDKDFERVLAEVAAAGQFIRHTNELESLPEAEYVQTLRKQFYSTLSATDSSFALAFRMLRKTSMTIYTPEDLMALNVWKVDDLWYAAYYHHTMPGRISNETHHILHQKVINTSNYMLIDLAEPRYLTLTTSTVATLIDDLSETPHEDAPWSSPIVGAVAAVPVIYSTVSCVYPGVAGTAFEGYDLIVTGFLEIQHWVKTINDVTQGYKYPMVLLEPEKELLYVHTLYDFLPVTLNCSFRPCDKCELTYATACLQGVDTLGETILKAVRHAVGRNRSGEFFTKELPGTKMEVVSEYKELRRVDDVELSSGEYFIRLTDVGRRVFGDHRISLLWLRPVSSVNDKVFAALLQLIAFCAVIFVIDVVLAFCEALFIANPMVSLASAVSNLKRMDLDAARITVHHTRSSCILINEVDKLSKGLLFAIGSLEEYKAYLPRTLFSLHDSQRTSYCECGATTTMETVPEEHHQAPEATPVTTLGLAQVAKGTLAVITVPFSPEGYSAALAAVEAAVTSGRGVLHGFSTIDPGTLYASWDVVQRCDRPCVQAAMTLHSLRATRVAGGIVTGKILAGNVGTENFRGFAAVGQAVESLGVVMAYSKTISEEVGEPVTVVTAKVKMSVSGVFEVIPVGVLRENDNTTISYALGKFQEPRTEEEWMYLADACAGTPTLSGHLATAFDSLANGVRPPEGLLCSLYESQATCGITRWVVNQIQQSAGEPRCFVKTFSPSGLREALPVACINSSAANIEDGPSIGFSTPN